MDPVTDRLASVGASLRWLIRLRWHASAGAAAALAIAELGLDAELPVAAVAAVIAAIVATNLALGRVALATRAGLGQVIVLDAVLLTLLLAATGGPGNPFAVLYLLLITLASLLAGRAWRIAVLAVSAAGYAALFAWHHPVPALDAWFAHGLAAALAIGAIAHALTVGKVTESLRAANARIARAETLAAVGTLAAGAAHELGTPLGSIAIASSDLERLLTGASAETAGEALDEARAIRDEVDRCRRIVARMAARAGVAIGELPATMTARGVVDQLRGELEPADLARLHAEVTRDATFRCLPGGLVHALANLVRNALQASDDVTAVTLTADVGDARVRFTIDDDGRGVPADVLPRLGEPFFTTRPGAGMGLGLYLSRSYAELSGGRLDVAPRPGRGTRVTLELPRA